jgi:hypothetical protein
MSVVECDVPGHSAWPIFFLGSDELVAGRDNKHMDFRLSIMKMHDGIRPSIVVSTLCMIHNKFGQLHHSFSQIWLAQADGERACCTASLALQKGVYSSVDAPPSASGF